MIARGILYEIPRQSNVHIPYPNELAICSDINGFPILV